MVSSHARDHVFSDQAKVRLYMRLERMHAPTMDARNEFTLDACVHRKVELCLYLDIPLCIR